MSVLRFPAGFERRHPIRMETHKRPGLFPGTGTSPDNAPVFLFKPLFRFPNIILRFVARYAIEKFPIVDSHVLSPR